LQRLPATRSGSSQTDKVNQRDLVLRVVGGFHVSNDRLATSERVRVTEVPTATPDPPVTPASLEELIFRDILPQIAHLQYAMAADQLLLVELLRDLAHTNPNPAQYLDDLYERVLARWQRNTPPPEHSKIDAMFREALNKRIAIARDAL
jgi:hypothetical protein